jgi:predicted RNA polymerase sigma factor
LGTPQCIHDDGQILGKFAMLAQDALVSALEQWPKSGIPDKPGVSLMPAAKLRTFDRLRRTKGTRSLTWADRSGQFRRLRMACRPQ